MHGVSCFHSLHCGPTIVRRRAQPCIVVDIVEAFAKRYSVKVLVVVFQYTRGVPFWGSRAGYQRMQKSGSPPLPKTQS